MALHLVLSQSTRSAELGGRLDDATMVVVTEVIDAVAVARISVSEDCAASAVDAALTAGIASNDDRPSCFKSVSFRLLSPSRSFAAGGAMP